MGVSATLPQHPLFRHSAAIVNDKQFHKRFSTAVLQVQWTTHGPTEPRPGAANHRVDAVRAPNGMRRQRHGSVRVVRVVRLAAVSQR